MIILLLFLSVPLLVMGQLVLPALFLLNSCLKESEWSLTDAFFLGILLNVFFAIGLLPFVDSTQALSDLVRIAITALCFLLVAFEIKKRTLREYLKRMYGACCLSLQKAQGLIVCVVTLLFVLFVFSHNLGFDDVAHLHYLDGVFDGKLFPVYRDLVDRWEAARYPAFGLLIGVLGSGVEGSGLFLYYLSGLLVHICFFVKVYEFCYARFRNVWQGLAVTALTAFILTVFALGNYFNYGLYPLGVSKLLFMIGVCYLFLNWRTTQQRTWFFMGAGLLTTAVLYHLNLLLLFVFFIPFLLVYIFIQRKSFKEWVVYCCFFFSFSVLAIPSALAPQNGIFHYIEPIRVVKSGENKAPVEIPSVFEKDIIKIERLVNWVEEGRYKAEYFKRAFSPELFLVPTVVVFFCSFSLYQFLSYIFVCLFLITISVEVVRTVPRQMMIASFRSGTIWMIADLLRSNVDLRATDMIRTDPYTGLYLKVLGRTQVKVMDAYEQTLLFYPFFSLQTAKEQLVSSVDRQYLVNGRMLGIPGVTRLSEKEKDVLSQQKKKIIQTETNFTLLNYSSMAFSTLKMLKEQLFLPFFYKSLPAAKGECSNLLLLKEFLGDEPIVWRDKAVIPLNDLRAGTRIEIDTPGLGYETDTVAIVSLEGDKVLKHIKEDAEDKMFFSVEKDVERVLLIVVNEEGHFKGLGRVDSISVHFLAENEQFSFE